MTDPSAHVRKHHLHDDHHLPTRFAPFLGRREGGVKTTFNLGLQDKKIHFFLTERKNTPPPCPALPPSKDKNKQNRPYKKHDIMVRTRLQKWFSPARDLKNFHNAWFYYQQHHCLGCGSRGFEWMLGTFMEYPNLVLKAWNPRDSGHTGAEAIEIGNCGSCCPNHGKM